MSKAEKPKRKLLNGNSSFTWCELVTLLNSLGHEQWEGSGLCRFKFGPARQQNQLFSNGNPPDMISLHRPHPGNELKPYIRRKIIRTLREGGLV
jgi:hypothetical protein